MSRRDLAPGRNSRASLALALMATLVAATIRPLARRRAEQPAHRLQQRRFPLLTGVQPGGLRSGRAASLADRDLVPQRLPGPTGPRGRVASAAGAARSVATAGRRGRGPGSRRVAWAAGTLTAYTVTSLGGLAEMARSWPRRAATRTTSCWAAASRPTASCAPAWRSASLGSRAGASSPLPDGEHLARRQRGLFGPRAAPRGGVARERCERPASERGVATSARCAWLSPCVLLARSSWCLVSGVTQGQGGAGARRGLRVHDQSPEQDPVDVLDERHGRAAIHRLRGPPAIRVEPARTAWCAWVAGSAWRAWRARRARRGRRTRRARSARVGRGAGPGWPRTYAVTARTEGSGRSPARRRRPSVGRATSPPVAASRRPARSSRAWASRSWRPAAGARSRWRALTGLRSSRSQAICTRIDGARRRSR